jgi:hypothetical protein
LMTLGTVINKLSEGVEKQGSDHHIHVYSVIHLLFVNRFLLF